MTILDTIIEDNELNKIVAGLVTHHPEYNSIERMNFSEQQIKHLREIDRIQKEKFVKELQESWENHMRQEIDRLEKELKTIKGGRTMKDADGVIKNDGDSTEKLESEWKNKVKKNKGIYGYMYGKPYVNVCDKNGMHKEKDKIIFIKHDELEFSGFGMTFVWGWPGPDYNIYKYDDYGVTWAFTKEELE